MMGRTLPSRVNDSSGISLNCASDVGPCCFLGRLLRGLKFIDGRDDLIAALDGNYRPFVPDCSNCRAPSILIPKYEKQRECVERFWRRKAAHNFTQGSPGPWNSGDIIWCLDCGKQASTEPYFFFQTPAGGAGV